MQSIDVDHSFAITPYLPVTAGQHRNRGNSLYGRPTEYWQACSLREREIEWGPASSIPVNALNPLSLGELED